MSAIGQRCHELRIVDGDTSWRIAYYIGTEAVVILAVFGKKTQATPPQVIAAAKKRLKLYQNAAE
ncbi:MAG: hypothetical protein QOJ98_316 [Acidobacteriota bacterium]|jgi:phage-related protein|nr:hypothetical protein [Acidobacteriota bacterium]